MCRSRRHRLPAVPARRRVLRMRCGAQQAHPLAAALAAAASRSGRRHACAATRVPRCQRSYCRVPRCQRSYCVAAGATSACACAATGAMAARSCRLPSRGEPSPGVDVGGVSPSPGADVGGVSPSPAADAAVVRVIMPSPVCADIRQTPQLITCTWRTYNVQHAPTVSRRCRSSSATDANALNVNTRAHCGPGTTS